MLHIVLYCKRIFLACFIAAGNLFLGGCGANVDVVIWFSSGGDTVIPFLIIATPASSAIGGARLVVVRDISSWNALWMEHVATISAPPALPAVNFSQDMVIAVFLGSRSNACYRVAIQSVTRRFQPDRLEVVYRETAPTPTTQCQPVPTNPVAMVTVPSSQLPVEFIAVLATE